MVEFLTREEGFSKITKLASRRIPFLFIISYDKSKIFVSELNRLPKEISYSINSSGSSSNVKGYLKRYPISFERYLESFNRVIEEIKSGNTYLLNLTFKSRIETNLSLDEIFKAGKAPYKLYIKDRFLCFSPETFIKIRDNQISTYPMKGTIDAKVPNAKEKILENPKELAEHTMIVDLLRNDLNIIATKTRVSSFRYLDKIKAGDRELLQVSSKIEAQLEDNWQSRFGEILDAITPAGSITGTPKKKTMEIIESIESYNRGFYTGIFGVFNGNRVDSAVMIRAMGYEKNSLFYYSGGGITIDSNAKSEYQEIIDKIYIPL
jgi:para-aminobenzoate synthetase component 1